MKKLYTVSVELNALVWAESPNEAREIAHDQRAISDQANGLYYTDYEAFETRRCMPDNLWTPGELVYHAGQFDLTVQECLDEENKSRGETQTGS